MKPRDPHRDERRASQRRRILDALDRLRRRWPVSIREIAEQAKVSRATAAARLAELDDTREVEVDLSGRWPAYRRSQSMEPTEPIDVASQNPPLPVQLDADVKEREVVTLALSPEQQAAIEAQFARLADLVLATAKLLGVRDRAVEALLNLAVLEQPDDAERWIAETVWAPWIEGTLDDKRPRWPLRLADLPTELDDGN